MGTIFGELNRLFRSETKAQPSYHETRAIAELKDSLSRAIRAAIVHHNGDCLKQFLFDARQIGLDVAIVFEYYGKQRKGVIIDCTECLDNVPAIRMAVDTDDHSPSPVWTFRLEEMSNVQLCSDVLQD